MEVAYKACLKIWFDRFKWKKKGTLFMGDNFNSRRIYSAFFMDWMSNKKWRVG